MHTRYISVPTGWVVMQTQTTAISKDQGSCGFLEQGAAVPDGGRWRLSRRWRATVATADLYHLHSLRILWQTSSSLLIKQLIIWLNNTKSIRVTISILF